MFLGSSFSGSLPGSFSSHMEAWGYLHPFPSLFSQVFPHSCAFWGKGGGVHVVAPLWALASLSPIQVNLTWFSKTPGLCMPSFPGHPDLTHSEHQGQPHTATAGPDYHLLHHWAMAILAHSSKSTLLSPNNMRQHHHTHGAALLLGPQDRILIPHHAPECLPARPAQADPPSTL